jgi:predicted lactoylglutathione lyase
MTKQIWINLPVSDVDRSRKFYMEMGFKLNERFGNSNSAASLLVGEKNVVLMLFDEPSFSGFAQSPVADTLKGTEVLFSIDAESKEEVDEMATRAVKAGGKSNHQAADMKGWMYGCLFTDPDGHRWNVLYMDPTQMPG